MLWKSRSHSILLPSEEIIMISNILRHFVLAGTVLGPRLQTFLKSSFGFTQYTLKADSTAKHCA